MRGPDSIHTNNQRKRAPRQPHKLSGVSFDSAKLSKKQHISLAPHTTMHHTPTMSAKQPEKSLHEPSSTPMGRAIQSMSRDRLQFASRLAGILEKASPNLPQLPKRNNQPVQRA
jgi:hypothetical protein